MKIVTYTANIGGYDKVYPPLVCNRLVDWVYFADDPKILEKAGAMKTGDVSWKPRLVATLTDDNVKESRLIHINSMKWFPEHEFAVQHDANIQLLHDPFLLVDLFMRDADIALFRHPHRTSVVTEVHACAAMNKDTPWAMWPQVQRYLREGMPQAFGLYACMLIVWRHGNAVRRFQEMWWEEVKNGSRREQLSFPYVLWRMRDEVKVNIIPGDPFTSPIMRYHQHG